LIYIYITMENPRIEMETFSSIQYKAAKYDDKLVLVRDCMTGQKGITCLDCGKDLVVKKGNIKQHHFAHAKGSSCLAYSGYTGKGGETVEHYKAKAKIAERFNNAEKLQITRRLCLRCFNDNIIIDLSVYKQKGYFACVEFNYIDKTGTRRKADVAIIDNSGNCHFIVEIKKTHATPESNREGFSWVELCATSVIYNTDDKFTCSRCPNKYCDDCESEIKKRQEILKQERIKKEQEERRRAFAEKQAQLRKEEDKRLADELERKELENKKRIQKEEEERRERIRLKMLEKYQQEKEERIIKQKEEEDRLKKQKEEQRIAHERQLRIADLNRKYKLDFMEVLKEIKKTVTWIEPIKPSMKKMVLATNTSCKSRFCLTCKKYNNGITARCVCERPRYKPLDGVLLFV